MEESQFPNELLRKKLVVAGIPESEHSVDSLAAKIPDRNAPSWKGISPDMVAELLLYLISKGIVTLPVASDQALLDMPWGSHVCQFYDGKEDLMKMLVPYFKQGLERNEACVWVVGDLTVDEASNALAAAVPDLEVYGHVPAQRAHSQSRQNLRATGRMGARQVQRRAKDRSGVRLAGRSAQLPRCVLISFGPPAFEGQGSSRL